MMKKICALLLSLILVCLLPLATAESYLDLGEEGTYYYAPEYGLALVEMPELLADSPYFIIPGIMAVDEELNAAALYAELLVPLSEPDEEGNTIDIDMLFGMAIVGMEGDLSRENAAKLAEEYSLNIEDFTEEKRLDGHNIFVNAAFRLDPEEKCTPELDALITDYQKALPEMFAGIVNIRRLKPAGTFTFTCAAFDGSKIPAKELFSKAEYTLLELVTSYYGDMCLPTAKELQGACEELGTQRMQLVLVCTDAREDDEYALSLKNQMKEEGLSNLCLLYTDETQAQLPAYGYPTIYLADREGNLIASYPGGYDDKEGYLSWLSELGIY